jgi:hypothetical protein
MKLIPHPIEENELRNRLKVYETLIEGMIEDYRMEEHKQTKIKTDNDVQERFKLMK